MQFLDNPTLRVGSLFTGCGGLDLGFQQVFPEPEMAFMVERGESQRKVLQAHFPGIPLFGDITEIDWHEMPGVDVLIGGSPCQDLSVAGQRQGLTDGTRSGLWSNMAKAIKVLRPRLVVWENVKGALSATASVNGCETGTVSGLESQNTGLGNIPIRPVFRAIGRVLGDLADLGYNCRWGCVRASDIGAAHERERVFLLAVKSSIGFPTPDFYPPKRRKTGRKLPTPTANLGRLGAAVHKNPAAGTSLLEVLASLDAGGNSVLWDDYYETIKTHEKALGRACPAPIQRTRGGKAKPSVEFIEWLMMLPGGWVTHPCLGLSYIRQCEILGNAVVPAQAAFALRVLLNLSLPASQGKAGAA